MGVEAWECDREEQAREGHCVPRAQDEDRGRAHEERSVQEQAREDREPQAEPRREAAVRPYAQWLEHRVDEGAQGLEREGRAGPGLVREGEVFLLEVSEGRMSDASLRPDQTAPALGSGALPLPV